MVGCLMREPSIESLLYFFFFFVSQIFLVWRAKILLNDCSQVVDDCSQGIQDLNEAPFLFYDHREGCICVFRYNLEKKKKETKYLVSILYAVLQFTNCLWKPKCIGYYTMLSQAHAIISGAVLSPVSHRWKHTKKSISNLQKSNLIE